MQCWRGKANTGALERTHLVAACSYTGSGKSHNQPLNPIELCLMGFQMHTLLSKCCTVLVVFGKWLQGLDSKQPQSPWAFAASGASHSVGCYENTRDTFVLYLASRELCEMRFQFFSNYWVNGHQAKHTRFTDAALCVVITLRNKAKKKNTQTKHVRNQTSCQSTILKSWWMCCKYGWPKRSLQRPCLA